MRRVVKLDEIPELRQMKHADHLIIEDNRIIIVEETSRPKTDDIEKLANTVQAVRAGKLANHIGNIDVGKVLLMAVLHSKRRIDSMVARMLHAARLGMPLISVSCDKELAERLKQL